MRTLVPLVLLVLWSSVALAQDDRNTLLEQANLGHADAQHRLADNYLRLSNHLYSEARATFWLCHAALSGHPSATQSPLLTENLANWQELCPTIIEEGIEKGFNVYYESGEFISKVRFGDEYKMTVPSERLWKLEFPRKKCKTVCQSLVRVNGQVFVDEDKNLTIHGEFVVDSNTQETSTLWLRSGTELSFNVVGHPNGVTISEYAQ